MFRLPGNVSDGLRRHTHTPELLVKNLVNTGFSAIDAFTHWRQCSARVVPYPRFDAENSRPLEQLAAC